MTYHQEEKAHSALPEYANALGEELVIPDSNRSRYCPARLLRGDVRWPSWSMA